MGISQKDMINSLSNLLNWLEQENSWGTNKGELKFITSRIGELYVAIMTNGLMANKTNQEGYDVVSEDNERISVKATTTWRGSHQFKFNRNTLSEVDRVVLVYINVEDVTVKIIYDELKEDAEILMVDADQGKNGAISMSKIISKKKKAKKVPVVKNTIKFDNYVINRLESGQIQLLKNNTEQVPVKPILKKIAKDIGVDINNSNSNLKDTRALGWDIMKQLS